MENIKDKFNTEIENLYAECDKNAENFIKAVDDIKDLILKSNMNARLLSLSKKTYASNEVADNELIINSNIREKYFNIVKNVHPKKWTAFHIISFFDRPVINQVAYNVEFSRLKDMIFETEKYDEVVDSFLNYMLKINKHINIDHMFILVAINFIGSYTISLVNIQEQLPNAIKKLKDSINEIKKYMEQNIIIPKYVIKNVNGKNIANDLISEETKQRIIDLAKEYNAMLEKKKNTPVQKSDTKQKEKKQTREERIAQHEKERELKVNSFYVDSEDVLTKEQSDAVIQYVNMVSSADEKESLDVLLELLPIEKFADERVLLNEVINKLKRKNINHLTNEVLIVLNNRLKDTMNCKKKANKSKKQRTC